MQNLISEIRKQTERENEIDAYFPDEIIIGIYIVNCKELKNQLMDKHRNIIKKLIELIYNLIKYHYVEVKKMRESIIARLRTNPTEIRALSDLKK